MNILIIGAGSVGFLTAEYFIREGHNVTIIDIDPEKINKIQESLDINAIEGQGTDIKTLQQANIHKADLFLALTENDEVNIIACSLAKHCKVPRKIARLNRHFHLEQENAKVFSSIGVDEIIDAESSLIEKIITNISLPGTADLQHFLGDQYVVGVFSFNRNSPFNKKKLRSLKFPFPVTPLGYTKLDKFKPYDPEISINEFTYIYFGMEKKYLKKAHKIIYPKQKKVRSAVIYGSGYQNHKTSIRLGLELEKAKIKDLKIITSSPKKAKKLSRQTHIPIILDDPTKPLFVSTENISELDAFIAISDNFEKNFFSGLVAYQNNVPFTISLVKYPKHINFISTIPLTSFINPAVVTANKIMKYHKINTIASRIILNFEQVECLEIIINENSKVLDTSIGELPFTHSKCIAIKRQNKFIQIRNNTVFKAGDQALFMIIEQEKSFLPDLI